MVSDNAAVAQGVSNQNQVQQSTTSGVYYDYVLVALGALIAAGAVGGFLFGTLGTVVAMLVAAVVVGDALFFRPPTSE